MGTSPKPFTVEIRSVDNTTSVRIVDARGGVVALMKSAGGRKLDNAAALVEAFNHANPS